MGAVRNVVKARSACAGPGTRSPPSLDDSALTLDPYPCLGHIVPGEAGDALVVVGKVLELGAGDVAVQVL
jgi:hypothetical protein